MRLTTLVILSTMSSGWFVSACGTRAMPSFAIAGKDASVPDHTVAQEGALEPILSDDGTETGVMAPSNAVRKVFEVLHLRPVQESFEVVADAMKTEQVKLRVDGSLSPVLSYPLQTIMGEYSLIIDAFGIEPFLYPDGYALTTGTVSKNVFTIRSADFTDGATVTVRFHDEKSFKKLLKLKYAAVGDVLFASSAPGCANKNTLNVQGQDVTIACMFGNKATHTLSYAGKDPTYQDFTLDDVADPEKGTWKVYANGLEIKEYTRDGKTVSIQTPLNEGVTVVLVFIPA